MKLLNKLLNKLCPVIIEHKTMGVYGIQSRYEKTNRIAIKCEDIKRFVKNMAKEFKKLL